MSLRDEFKAEILSAIGRSQDLGYNPTIFQQMITANHPVEVGKKLVVSGEWQHGIKEMAKLGHLELTIESVMLQPQFKSLFTPAELAAAQWRLDNVPTK